MENIYEGFTECYLDLAKQVYNDCDFESSPRGFKIKEKLGVKFTILNPRKRIPYVPARKFSMHYMIAELLWYISGNNSTKWIANYASFWNNISDDGETANSAYGARIFKEHPRISSGELKQWDYVLNELREDRDSRRAVIHIRVPEDSAHAKLDVPCTLSLQFFIRDNKLHQIAHMRSSDLILGIAYDIPAFTFIQEMLAMELGIELGTYTHVSNSLHIYERHFDMVTAMLDQHSHREEVTTDLPSQPPIDKLMLAEQDLRAASSLLEVRHVVAGFAAINTSYWTDWVKILASYRLKQLKLRADSVAMQNSTQFVGYHKDQGV